ncbi:MAG: hypothetical protein N3E45_05545 [Oscillatoriaceae bacterium SKW80]|nr:hypothetical protein [Oscillatoriaceae bacterium SKYG93]MCX8120279.1 hypothetical protein [Oscillatoriaceae bacterium SKW80]MDW8453204.1 hypothetical protein [Oscillatoriaceae cyanobacterium SKYGB_i_bin93]HIK28884.1 hypothetical protein [Oscillatoriaceae cyanobacterium M7585_C2015_266]
MNRKLLGLALILSLSVIVGGCAQGEKTQEPATPSPANTPTTPAAEPANTPAPAAGKDTKAPAAEKDTKAPATEKDTKAPATKDTKETKPAAKESPKTP